MSSLFLPEFPMPPSVNALYASIATLKHGAPRVLAGIGDIRKWVVMRRTLTSAGRVYKAEASRILIDSGQVGKIRSFIQEHELVDLFLYVHKNNWLTLKGQANKNAGDGDNRVKVVQDSIFSTVGIDDSVVFFTGVRKIHTDGPEKVVAVLRPTPAEVDEF